jgi:hypothetical protein
MRLPVHARWAPVLAILVACAKFARDRPVAWLVIETADVEPDALESLDALRVTPPEAFVRAVRTGSRVVVGLDVRASAAGVRVDVPGSCPVAVEPSELVAGATVHKVLASRITLLPPAHPRDLGHDARFVVDAVLGCPAPSERAVTWRQVAGPPLREVLAEGLRFEARTAPAAEQDVASRPSWGIVPVSARASDEIAVEAALPSSGDRTRRRMTLAAASRSRGLPNVAVDEGILLAGRGWTVQRAPRGAVEGLRAAGELTALIPDVAGTWLLHDTSGHTLSLHSGRYDETPLDCGRATCHGPIAAAARESRMTEALHRQSHPGRVCAAACHATGEPGAHDGGFTDLARELGFIVGEADWDELPRSMRRVGGVTCLACHGPGAIPEASGRWAILRSDVCATCHDAPPTYGHVSAWRSSRMAHADADPRTRSSQACARCHTTSGFLANLRGGGGGETDTRSTPADIAATGIACAACHAPHQEHRDGASAALVREVPRPAWLEGVVVSNGSAICVPCHSPVTPNVRVPPGASAASIWAGRGGVDPGTGGPLAMTAVHAGVPGGCPGCHDEGPTSLERGKGHGFRTAAASCTPCHAGTVPDAAAVGRGLENEAASLLSKLESARTRGRAASPDAPGGDPRHARDGQLTDDLLGRAEYDALLVLEDPGAGAHNAPFARALLAAARAAVQGRPEGITP